MAALAGTKALAKENWAVVLSPTSDRWVRGEAVDLTEEEGSFFSKLGASGCYGKSTKDMHKNLVNRQKATARDLIVQNTICPFPPLKNRFGLLSDGSTGYELSEKGNVFRPGLKSKVSFKDTGLGQISEFSFKNMGPGLKSKFLFKKITDGPMHSGLKVGNKNKAVMDLGQAQTFFGLLNQKMGHLSFKKVTGGPMIFGLHMGDRNKALMGLEQAQTFSRAIKSGNGPVLL